METVLAGQAVEAVHQAQGVGHQDVGDREGARQPFAAGQDGLHVLEPGLQEAVHERPAGGVLGLAAELEQGPGQAGHLHGIEGGEQPLGGLAAAARVGRHEGGAALPQMKQDRAALEDREVAVGQPGDLGEGLVGEVLRTPVAERGALDAVGQAGLFQRPAHAQVPHEAARRLGDPVVGGEDQLVHPARSWTRLPRGRADPLTP